ncbi:MAG: GxxExxY protein [Prevotella sp.]|nr:GxxExxY protein [Prevotella sp.]
METKELIDAIAACAKRVRSQLTPGFEEKVYKNAMFIELRDCGVNVETEVPFQVYYKNHIVGDYRADMIVERRVIVELKAVHALLPIHEVQLVNYLTATGIDDGMLINFGSDRIEIRHRSRLYHLKPE